MVYRECINIESHFYASFFFSTFLISIVAHVMCASCTVTSVKLKGFIIIIIIIIIMDVSCHRHFFLVLLLNQQ